MTPMVLSAILLSTTLVSSAGSTSPASGVVSTPSASVAEIAWRACVDRTTTNFEWSQCGGAYVRDAEAALNAGWAKLMTVADGNTKVDLVAEERAWVAYKETACKFYQNGDWGREGEVLHGPGCLAGVIERRTRVLSDYLDFLTQR